MNGTRNNGRPQRRGPPGAIRRGASPKRPQQQGGRHNNTAASAQRNYERYLALARDAASAGDTVEMENCYQHAEHYFRVMQEQGS
jgi:hypothetical protein